MAPSIPATQPPTEAKPRRSVKLRRILPLILLLAGVGAVIWYLASRPDSDELEFSGRIEGYETDVGAKVAEQVIEVTVREGAEVKPGQLLVKLDDDEVQAQLSGAEARIQAAKQQEQNAKL